MIMHAVTLVLDVIRRPQAELYGSGFQRLQYLCRDELVEFGGG